MNVCIVHGDLRLAYYLGHRHIVDKLVWLVGRIGSMRMTNVDGPCGFPAAPVLQKLH